MLVVFGKGKVGNAVSHLLTVLGRSFVIMDDEDIQEDLLFQADQIIVSPGIKKSHLLYQKYENKLISELNFLGAVLDDMKIRDSFVCFGITGTNGKSTTTWVMYHMLVGLFPQGKVWLTGNFGVPVSEVLAQILESHQEHEKHLLVIECSSFMLYGLQNFWFDYGVVLNVARDHLDWHADFDEYRTAKMNLVTYSRVLGVDHYPAFGSLEGTQFVGHHNQTNIGAVFTLLRAYFAHSVFSWDEHKAFSVLQTISPLDHRLKLFREVQGVKIYDDGICTSSHSLNAALEAFDQKLVWVGGGYDKGDDYTWIEHQFHDHVAYAVIMGQVTPKLVALCEAAGVPYLVVSTLDAGISEAFIQAQQQGLSLILYSPGAASFDMFKNVYHRVEEFERIVKAL